MATKAEKEAAAKLAAEKKLAEDTAAAEAAGLTLAEYQAQQTAPAAKAPTKKDGPITVHFPATGATRTFLPEHAHDGMSHAELAEACRTNPGNGKEGVYLEE